MGGRRDGQGRGVCERGAVSGSGSARGARKALFFELLEQDVERLFEDGGEIAAWVGVAHQVFRARELLFEVAGHRKFEEVASRRKGREDLDARGDARWRRRRRRMLVSFAEGEPAQRIRRRFLGRRWRLLRDACWREGVRERG